VNLLNLEQCYLSCLLNGAAVQDITLNSESHERIHGEIKRLKNNGFVTIPKSIISGTETICYDEKRELVEFYAREIAEETKKRAVKRAAEGARQNLPSEMLISNLREELDRIAEQTGKNDIISAEQLQNKDFQNTEFIVDKIIPVGMTLLIGAPKTGKSWLLLLLSQIIAMGITIFGFKAKRVPVLYYTLEDSVKRCKYRLNKLYGGNIKWSNNLYFTEKQRGTAGIVNDIKATGARVVIIDTIGAFTTVNDGNDYYETTRITREIKDIADTMQVAIIVVHHTKKDKTGNDWTANIMGSQGWVGAADTIIYLNRERDKTKAKLHLTGRDISECFIHIKFNDGTWEVDNDA